MQVKICGIKDRANMHELALLRPDYLGFILYGPSPRDVTNSLDHLRLDELPSAIDKVAVVVDQQLENVISLIEKYHFESVQLHGHETPAFCRALSEYCLVIKAFSVRDRLPDILDEYEGVCDLFLFDAAGEKRGGNGEPFDHDILRSYARKTPFLLGGGLSMRHTEGIIRLAEEVEAFAGIDINSRFETSPGIKDTQLVKNFLNMIKL